MKYSLLLAIHLISLLVRLFRPGGMKAVAAENLILKWTRATPNPGFIYQFVMHTEQFIIFTHKIY